MLIPQINCILNYSSYLIYYYQILSNLIITQYQFIIQYQSIILQIYILIHIYLINYMAYLKRYTLLLLNDHQLHLSKHQTLHFNLYFVVCFLYSIFHISYHLIDMERQTQHALVLQKEKQTPVYKEVPVEKPKYGEILVKVEASTINPSDRMVIDGQYPKKRPLPFIAGLEATGTVVEANGEDIQKWIGKRASFRSYNGTWCQYSVTTPNQALQIQADVPTSSAASGTINPLTALGFVENCKTLGGKGIINTAAASTLGRMLNKLCIKYKVPFLGLVRKQQQAQLLKKQGATHVIVTTGDWQKKFKQLVQKEGFNVVYDALGGGKVTQAIITNLNPHSVYHLYGKFQKDPLTLHDPTPLFSGVVITSFFLDVWWNKATQEIKQKIRKQYSSLLKNQLATRTSKELNIKQIEEGIKISIKKSGQGKVLLKI